MTHIDRSLAAPTADNVRSLSEKLEALDRTLPDGERLVLRSIITSAFRQQAGQDVQGFNYETCPLQQDWWNLMDWTCYYWRF